MLDRELTYQLSLERLLQLCKSGARKSFPACIWCKLIPLLSIVAMLCLMFVPSSGILDRLGLTEGAKASIMFGGIGVIVAASLIGLQLVRKANLAELKKRVDFDDSTCLRALAEGLSFRSEQIDYLVKWRGINLMFLEPDGIVFVHGSLYFLVPDSAFASKFERNTFIRDVFARLGDQAQKRSETFMRPVLDVGTAGP